MATALQISNSKRIFTVKNYNHLLNYASVIKLNVNVGDKVTKGSTICVIEAMKMENDIQSEVDGVVKEIFIEPGDAVSAGDTLMVIQ